MNRSRISIIGGIAVMFALVEIAGSSVFAQATTPKPEFPPHSQVLADYTRIISTTDGLPSLYTLYKHKKEQKLLAELPASFTSHKYFLALTVAAGDEFAGLQQGDLYFYWRRYGDRLAMIEPNIEHRSTGDNESKASVSRLFTDRVLLDTPILTIGPTGGPVIDLNYLFVSQSSTFFGSAGRISNSALVTIKQAKAFPKNIEVAIEGPTSGSFSLFGGRTPNGQLKTLHYSLSLITPTPGYTPRVADPRIGYFTTGYTDLGKYKDTETRTRFINRWHLTKRDPSLSLSPPVEPIRFILEHTVPVRYRRWVTQGVDHWNKAFEKVGFLNAIEIDFQDAQTGRNMDLDPEDVRYNFIRWLNNDVGTAIGPSRVNPLTGEILDADIILTDGWIRHYYGQFSEILPAVAMEGFNAETLAWLSDHPQWDPRVRLANPSRRDEVMRTIQRESYQPLAGHPAGKVDGTMIGDNQYDGLIGRSSQVNGLCMATQGKSIDLALMQMHLAILAGDADDADRKKKKKDGEGKDEKKDDDKNQKDGDKDKAADDKKDDDKKADEKKDDEKKDDDDRKEEDKKGAAKKVPMLDSMPESFIGPLIAELVAHEVGHTLGLRHNFKASSVYSFDEMNGDGIKGKKPLAGSVMDYIPINLRADGKPQGDYTMIGIGPYDEWAIEYGYTLASDLKPILARVNEPELVYGTDEETDGPDPRTRRYDFTTEPLDYANNQIELVRKYRKGLVEKFVKDGESWARARHGYELSLSLQLRSVSMMANWLGGAFTTRAMKGDKDSGRPVEVVPVEQQKAALKFVIANTFFDDAFGLSPELLAHLSVDKWLDGGSSSSAFSSEATYPVHDTIMGIQASVLTMVMNATTLRRIYDNEVRIPADKEALTLPEVLESLTNAIWQELENVPDKQYTARVPLVSSLRRNLQQEHLERLVDLSVPGAVRTEAYKPIANLAAFELDRILKRIDKVLAKGGDKLDPYTRSHLAELKEQVVKRRDAQYIYNAKDIKSSPFSGFLMFQEEQKRREQERQKHLGSESAQPR
ncbi:MAG: zinc-dependent metalloprotease [Rhodopirellula sp.]|nr:zinc-dependent metalloprotease [Rhodopirellula sp.]